MEMKLNLGEQIIECNLGDHIWSLVTFCLTLSLSLPPGCCKVSSFLFLALLPCFCLAMDPKTIEMSNHGL